MGILPTVQAWDTATTEGQRTASFSTQPEEMGSCAATAPAPNTIPVPVGFLCSGLSENRDLVLAGH